MSLQHNTCPKCGTYEFYKVGNLVPPCPRCGYPELKTSAEYYKSMGVDTVVQTQGVKMTTPQVGDRCCAEAHVEGEMMYGVITLIEGDLAWSDLDRGFCGDLPTRKNDEYWLFDSF